MILLFNPYPILPLLTSVTVEWLAITLGEGLNNQTAASVKKIAFCSVATGMGAMLGAMLNGPCPDKAIF